jgi:hypothetical protein
MFFQPGMYEKLLGQNTVWCELYYFVISHFLLSYTFLTYRKRCCRQMELLISTHFAASSSLLKNLGAMAFCSQASAILGLISNALSKHSMASS